MPYGEITWYDPSIGRGRIETSSGMFTVRDEDMEPSARTEHARVDFDVEHDDPHDRAVNVRLRGGGRNTPGAQRFGDTG